MRKATPARGIETRTLKVLAELSENLKGRQDKRPERQGVQKGDPALPWEPSQPSVPPVAHSERVNR